MIRSSGLCCRRRDDDIRSECFEKTHLFGRRFVCHYKNAFITLNRRGQCKSNSCITRCCFNDSSSGFDLPFSFGGFDHRDADSIFYRITWIKVFHLGEHRRLEIFGHAIELDQRRVADET